MGSVMSPPRGNKQSSRNTFRELAADDLGHRGRSADDEGGYASGGRAAGARNRSGGGGSYARPVETEFSSNAERLAYSKKGRPVEYRCVRMCTRVRASVGTCRRDADRAC